MESDLVHSESIDSGNSRILEQRILDSIVKHKCYSVKDLIMELQHNYSESLSVEEIQHAIRKLESEKKITLIEAGRNKDFIHYIMRSYNGISLWLTTAAACLVMAVVFLLPNTEPWFYMRMIAGTVFVLFIPGNALVQLLFAHRNMEQTEKIVLSVGLSIALISLIGLMLKYVLIALTVESAVISVGILSITLSAVANYSHFLHSKRVNDF